MKRFTAFVLAVIVAFSFASCGKENEKTNCLNCGESVIKSHSFCPACGASVDGDPETTSETETTTEATTVHVHSYEKNVVSPTCTEKGYTTYICECGDTYEDDYVNPTHSYSKYECTVCGAIDKAHAYGYFTEWIKKNGAEHGDEIGVGFTSSDINCSFIYDKNKGYMYALVKDNDGSKLTLYLSDPNKRFKYVFEKDSYYASGTINAKTFTQDTVITCDEYEGPSSKKDTVLKLAALLISIVPIHMNIQFKLSSIDLTHRDMGFENYDY